MMRDVVGGACFGGLGIVDKGVLVGRMCEKWNR